MGLRINTNIIALTAQHKLQGTSRKLNTALERLSSGLRINKGSDDVVGLLKSESLRSQIRGIATAEQNLANATNVLGVAEGSLAQLTDVAQRLRDYIVQAADASLSSTDRTNLSTIVTDLRNEFSRLVSASEFDGVNLLDGSFTSKAFQVGPNQGDSVSFSISDARSSAIGTVAVLTAGVNTTVSVTTSVPVLADPAGIEINDISIPSSAFASDGVSNAEGDESAIAYVRAINTYSSQTGVSATVLANVFTFTYGAGGRAIDAEDAIVLNGLTLDQAAYALTDGDMATFTTAINEHSVATGITAVIDTTANTVVLTAADGRNIDIRFTTTESVPTNTAFIGTLAFTAATAASFIQRGTFKLTSDETFTVDGADAEFAASDAVTVGLDTSTTLDDLDVSTAASSDTGIFILDNVIRQLQTKRSDVGSKLVRFQAAEAELQTRKENLTSSESRIRDADIAVEVANLTSAQILQQAGANVLSRANSIPQIALTLLQG